MRLTGRETEVLTLVAEGKSTREIGAVLGISVHTAKFHVQQIFSKLGVRSRVEAVNVAWQIGLLPGRRSTSGPAAARVPPDEPLAPHA